MSDGLTFNNLNYLITHNEDLISLTGDVILNGRLEALNFKDGIEIKSDNIVIDGNGHTIDAKGKIRIFNISAKNVTLKNINFKNGSTNKFGGAVRNEGGCEIINCTFEDNRAKKKGDDVSNGSEMFISDCKFSRPGSINNVGSIYAFESEIEQLKPYVSGQPVLVKPVVSAYDITFNIVDEENNPVKGAIVIIGERNASTDENGICSVDDVVEGIHKINITSEEYKNYIENIQVSEDNVRFSFALTKLKTSGGLNHIRDRPFQAYTGNEPYIFTSYAHADASRVFPELKRFHDLKLNIWYDEGITSGAGWQAELEDAIINSSLFIVFISQNSVESENVRKEIFLAIGEKIPIIPIYLEDTELKYGLKLEMKNIQAILKYELTEDAYLDLCKKDFRMYGFEIEY